MLSNNIINKIIIDRYSLAGVILLSCILILCCLSLVAPDPIEPNLQNKLLPPFSENHFFGTDQIGRDVFARICHGAIISLYVGTLSSLIATLFGVMVGVASGYCAGRTDTLLMRIADIFLAFPQLILIIGVAAIFKPNIMVSILIIGFTSWPSVARLIRSHTLVLTSYDFIIQAQSMKYSNFYIIRKHILPNCISPIIIVFTLGISSGIMAEASLSFIGLGVQAPNPSWGIMINEAKIYFVSATHLAILPGVAITTTVLSINIIGEKLRDVLDIKA